MATTRKKTTSGFSAKEEETKPAVSEKTEEIVEEVKETKEEPKVEKKPFVAESIAPPTDLGSYFESTPEPEPTPAPAPRQAAPELKAPPKRHPRNIPKFARYK
jgi:hypothetical protein